ncbi:MAG: 5'-deoxyadenosine deaminase [Myxococcales bacterium]|nr:5'-deoxyadenosine deaminase [Polyangiaceae bacterium]MDW8248244.1 5'-deoxyadenosine deaminase [Myxococcales bacterium]
MSVLLRGGLVVTCDPDHRVFQGDVALAGGRIVALGEEARAALATDYQVVHAQGKAVLPGLIQGHIHLVQTLFRGLAEDVPLLTWLRRFLWPLEAAHDERSLRVSAELGLAELLRGGTTTLLDMGTVHGHDVVLDACARSGIRALSGKAMMDRGEGTPPALLENTRAALREAERLSRDWPNRPDARVRYAFCPRFVLSCSEEMLRGCAALAAEAGALLHTHAAEQVEERAAVRALLGTDDLTALARCGITGSRTVLAHGVHLDDDEIRALAAADTAVVHCPSSNLKLGSGIARVADLHRAGVRVGLGADGAPCNNNLDAFMELRLAALLSKINAGTSSLSAREALHLATLGGARALGLGELIGSIEVGKRADVIVVDLQDIHTAPALDLFSTLVYACQSRDVRHVFVDGQQLVHDGELLTLDAPRIAAQAREEAPRIARKAGLA